MKIDNIRELNLDTSRPQSDTFTCSLRKLNGLIIEAVRGADGKAYFPANNCYLDIQRIGLNKKGKTLVNRVPLHVFMELTKLHLGHISNGSGIGCYINLGSLFLDEKDELQVSLHYDNRQDGVFYTVAENEHELSTTTTKPSSKNIRLKISTLDANNQFDYSLRYDKSKDYERPVNDVEAVYVYSDDFGKVVTSAEYQDMQVQFNRTVGNDLSFDFSTVCLASVMFNTIEDIEKQMIAQIYKNTDAVPSSGRLQLPMANNYKELTLLVVERVMYPKAMVAQAKKQLKEENDRLKQVAVKDEKDATALIVSGAVNSPEVSERAVRDLEHVEKVVTPKE